MYDVIVIGARCAGASTAMLLARKGYKVLLVDRATFPKDIPHGHFIHRHGPRCLQRWGLLDQIVATNCPPVTSITTDYGEIPLTGRELIVDGVALGYGPRRVVLDKVLIDAAVEAGAELREGFTMEGLTTDGDRITGIRGRERGRGSAVTERASITVGADGRNSHLARAVQAPKYEVTSPLTCWYFSYWSGVPHDGLQVAVRGNKVLFAFPTTDGLFGLFVAWSSTELPTVRADIEGQLMAAVDEVPELADRVRAGRREERFYGMADVPNFLRKPYGPGWALVGDAGCHKDPFLALGICDAFRDAELLVEALHSGLSGRYLLEQAMADYECQRNKATMVDYQQNLDRAQFKPLPAEMAQLRLALRGNQEDTNRYYMAIEGMIPPETFFNPENVQRIIGLATAGDV
jgi:flavin-dependent dehydrogenase